MWRLVEIFLLPPASALYLFVLGTLLRSRLPRLPPHETGPATFPSPARAHDHPVRSRNRMPQSESSGT